MRRGIVIALDGPAASGKSTTAKQIARILGYRHIDSGALYRALAAVQIRSDAESARWTEDSVLAGGGCISLRPADTSFVALVDGTECEAELRDAAVTRVVSLVASMPRVREWVNEQVRLVARDHDVVVDGRDIGTAVFPDAAVKIYLVADPWERARRRLIQRGGPPPSDDEIAAETDRLVHRDARDAVHSRPAPDAVLIDTTHLTQAEQVDRIVALAHAAVHRDERRDA